MGEEIAFENGQISDFQGLVTLTLTLDRVILHTIMHHSSTSTYIPNFIEIEETFYGQTDGRTDGRTDGHLRPTLLGRLGVDLKIACLNINSPHRMHPMYNCNMRAQCYRRSSVVCLCVCLLVKKRLTYCVDMLSL